MEDDPNMASAVAAIRPLLEFLKRDKERHLKRQRRDTWGLEGESHQCHRKPLWCGLDFCDRVLCWRALPSACQPHLPGVVITSNVQRSWLRGELFLRRVSLPRNKIADPCHTFIKDRAGGGRILTHPAVYGPGCDDIICCKRWARQAVPMNRVPPANSQGTYVHDCTGWASQGPKLHRLSDLYAKVHIGSPRESF